MPVTDDDLLRRLRDEVLLRTGAPDLPRAAASRQVLALEADAVAALGPGLPA